MDPIKNPYAPGAGTPPPELAGRDELRETVRITLERVRATRPTKSVLMVGLRGVGKTVLLDRLREDAEAASNRLLTERLEQLRTERLTDQLWKRQRAIAALRFARKKSCNGKTFS